MRSCDDDLIGPTDGERLVIRCRVRLSHPKVGQLERFVRGELARPAARAVVRHLLSGCPRCAEETRRFWELGARALKAMKLPAGEGPARAEPAEAALGWRPRGPRRL
jgi:anti-sigma factor RsiW